MRVIGRMTFPSAACLNASNENGYPERHELRLTELLRCCLFRKIKPNSNICRILLARKPLVPVCRFALT